MLRVFALVPRVDLIAIIIYIDTSAPRLNGQFVHCVESVVYRVLLGVLRLAVSTVTNQLAYVDPEH